MSMCCVICRISDECAAFLRSSPKAVDQFVWPGQQDSPDEPQQRMLFSGLLGLLTGRGPMPTTPTPSKVEPLPACCTRSHEDLLDLDASWHGVHYLLTGCAIEYEFPSGFLLSGGEQIVGYPFGRLFTPLETLSISKAINGVGVDFAMKRYNAERMCEEEVYPFNWHDGENVEWMRTEISRLCNFLNGSVLQKTGLIIVCR